MYLAITTGKSQTTTHTVYMRNGPNWVHAGQASEWATTGHTANTAVQHTHHASEHSTPMGANAHSWPCNRDTQILITMVSTRRS